MPIYGMLGINRETNIIRSEGVVILIAYRVAYSSLQVFAKRLSGGTTVYAERSEIQYYLTEGVENLSANLPRSTPFLILSN